MDQADALRFAWQVHQAQEAWTSKVDTKGSILLALQGGALFAIFSAHGKDGILVRLDGWRWVAEIFGVVALLLAILAAGLAVFPRLGAVRMHRIERRDHLVHFGHLRHWTADELHERLRSLDTAAELAALAGQLVRAGRTNWAKYRFLQCSLVLALLGIMAVSCAALLAR